MRAFFLRLPLVLLGAFCGALSQICWLGHHGWGEAAVRVPAGAVGGGLVFWLVGELLAWPARRRGRDFWGGVGRFWPFVARVAFWRAIAAGWLVLLAGFGVGLYVYATQSWPYPLVRQFEDWLRGEGNTTLVEKLANDLDIVPARHLVTVTLKTPGDRVYHNLEGLPLRSRRVPPKYYLAPDAPKVYRVVFGTFDFVKNRYGVLLLGPGGQVKHIWQPSQEGVPWQHRNDRNVFPHGFDIDRDGSIYVAYDNDTSLTKYDWCGRIVWRIRGGYHHSITLGDDGTLWTWGPTADDPTSKDCLVQIEAATGKVLKIIPLTRVIEANPGLDVLGIRQLDENSHSTWVLEGGGQWHPNDVDPLPRSLAPLYPEFKAGDLLLSLRSVDLVMVLDPDTLKVKWWRQGQTRRQHDPDWNGRGTITVFDNNMHRSYSRIVEIDPKTYKSKVLVPGKKYNFYSYIQGKHQMLPDGGLLITSPQQGRVFELDPKGKVVFEFLNLYDDKDRFLSVSEARILPLDYFKELPKCK